MSLYWQEHEATYNGNSTFQAWHGVVIKPKHDVKLHRVELQSGINTNPGIVQLRNIEDELIASKSVSNLSVDFEGTELTSGTEYIIVANGSRRTYLSLELPIDNSYLEWTQGYNNGSFNSDRLHKILRVEVEVILNKIKGTAKKQGTLIQGVKISCINQNTNELVGSTTSDENGEWEFSDLNESDLYHVVASLEDGEDKFNHLSYYDIEPKEDEE